MRAVSSAVLALRPPFGERSQKSIQKTPISTPPLAAICAGKQTPEVLAECFPLFSKLCSDRPRTGSGVSGVEKLFRYRNYFWEGPESDRKGHVCALWDPKVTFSITFGSLPKGRPAWQAAPYRAAKPSFFEYSNLVGDMRDPNIALCSNIKGTRASPAQQGPPGTRENYFFA